MPLIHRRPQPIPDVDPFRPPTETELLLLQNRAELERMRAEHDHLIRVWNPHTYAAGHLTAQYVSPDFL